MSDVITIEKLQLTEKHNTFHVDVITGRTGDYATNAVTGQVQKTLPATINGLDWSYIGKFADGVTFTKKTDFAIDASNTQWIYVGASPFPVVVSAGTVPSAPDYQVVHIGSLQALSGLTEPSDLDKTHRTEATLARLAAGDYGVGSKLVFAELGGAKFDVVLGGTPDGFSVRDAGSGNTAVLAEKRPIPAHFGAKGNWNAQTQTGANDTAAMQAFFDYMAAIPTKRKGGVRTIFLGRGNFKIDSLTLSSAFEFGIDIFGDGRDATVIWSDPADTNPSITGQIEFVTFRNMSCFGSLSESGGATIKKDCFYRGKLASNRADIDVKFINCHCGYATDFVQAYGRGVVFQGGTSVYITNLINIVCDASTVFTGSVNDTAQTGMRHYTVTGGHRADVVSRLIKVSGTAPQKDFINDILINGNDFASCDRLIDAPDGRLINPVIVGNQSIDSFAGGVVTAASLIGGQDVGNGWKNAYNNNLVPADNTDTIDWLYSITGSIAGLVIDGTYARGLKNGVVYAGAASSDVKVVHNQFPQAFTTPGNANRWVFSSPANCNGLTIDDNSFTSSGTSYTYQLFDAAVQTSKNTSIGINPAPWSWVDSRLRYTPLLKIAGTPTATATTAQGRYTVDANYVYVEAELVVNPVEASGVVAVSLPPVSAIAEAGAITASYAGGGSLPRVSGFSKVGYSVAPVQINPVTQEAELYMEKDLTLSRMDITDAAGVVSIFASFKYRHQ